MHSVPIIHISSPDAGWLPMRFGSPVDSLGFVTSCTPEDSLVTLVVWLEMLLLGELPADWYINSEEVGMVVTATAHNEASIELCIYYPFRCEVNFAELRDDPEQLWWHGVVDVRTLVTNWSTALRQALADNFPADAPWPLDVARLDFSHLDALLAGEAADPAWLPSYHPPETRALELSYPLLGQNTI